MDAATINRCTTLEGTRLRSWKADDLEVMMLGVVLAQMAAGFAAGDYSSYGPELPWVPSTGFQAPVTLWPAGAVPGERPGVYGNTILTAAPAPVARRGSST